MAIDKLFRPPFPPGRSEPCFCGSGRRFKHCCGSSAPGRPPPHGVEIIEGFLSPSEARQWAEFAATRPSKRLKVIDWDASDSTRITRKLDDRRVTERVHMGDRESGFRALMQRIYTDTIAPRMDCEFAWFEPPQMLKYSVGGFYQAHSDADSYDPPSGRWRHDLDRDVSVLLYLNAAFEGGDLVFEYFGYRLRPKPGMLVWFPSDARYYHGADPVTSGTRYAMVSWAARSDTAKVREVLPKQAVVLDPAFAPDSGR